MNYRFSVEPVTLDRKQLYPETELLIPVHSITLIIGSNGCGKTTLLNQILYQNPGAIAMIAQENDLIFHDLTVRNNIMIFQEDEALLSGLLARFGIGYLLHRDPKQLSGGEKRMIALLRMFFVSQEIIFLDEPTNDLDYRTVDTVKTIIAELRTRKTLLIVTHDDRLMPLADRTYRFQNGALQCGSDMKDTETAAIPRSQFTGRAGELIRTDAAGLLLFLFVIISVLCSGAAALLTEQTDPVPLCGAQTNLASKFYASPGTLLNNGYIPLRAYLQYRGNVGPEYLRNYSECVRDAMNTGGSLNMLLDQSSGSVCCLAMTVNTLTDQREYVMQRYLEKRKQQSGTPAAPDGIAVFDGICELVHTSENSKAEPIDSELYQQVADACMNEDPANQPVLYVILEPDRHALEQLEGNYFIKNSTTVEICRNVAALKSFLNSAKILGILLAGSLLLYFLYTSVSLKLLRKHMILMRNLGVPLDTVKETLFKKRSLPFWKLLTAALGSAACFLCKILHPAYSLLMLLLGVLCIILGIIIISVTHLLITHTIHRIYCYEGIYDH
ncbi:MAG: ATP-binding cassette domain-containing protein [Oscillospiraceae bacterium]|nr:ATP-binding cassette domain-containing protein [Oscillospiraceae bacterium]